MVPGRDSHGRAALVFVLLIGAFLWQPLTQGGLYGPFDILHSWPMVKAPDAPPLKNGFQSDVAIQIMPFIGFNRAEFAAGRIPLWNPYSAWGAPHLANGQSGVFSPFLLPLYWLDWRWGIPLSVALRLFVAGFFTYLFLRSISLSFWPAVSAGTIYMFSGPLMLWLLWQNSAVAAMLPVTMWAAERVVRIPERSAPLVWLGIVLATGMYSGHPEVFYFIAATLVTWAPLRLWLFPEVRAAWRHHAARLAAGCVLGVMLSAPQILPCLEYLRQSSEFGKAMPRHESLPGLHWTSLLLQVQPDLFGTAEERRAATNYIEINSNYAGAGAWLLAAAAAWIGWRQRSRAMLLFLSLSVFWFVYAFDAFGWYIKFIYRLPLAGMPIPKRAAMAGLLPLACLAGLALDWLSRLPRNGHLVRAAAVAGFWLFGCAALWYNRAFLLTPESPAHLLLPERLTAVVAGMLLISAWVIVPNPRWAFLLPVALYLQTGFQFRENTPVIQVSSPEGHSPAFDEIHRRIGPHMSSWEAATGMFSAINMWYRIRIGSNYDAIVVHDMERVGFPIWGINSPRYLKLFGMRYFVSDMAEPAMVRASEPAEVSPVKTRLAGTRLSREFRSLVHGLNAVRVAFDGVSGNPPECSVAIEVTDVASGKLITRQERRCAALEQRANTWIRFDDVADSKDRLFRVTLDASRVPANAALSVATSPAGPAIEPAAGIFGHLEPDWSGGGYHLFRVRDALPRFSIFGSTEVIPNLEQTVSRLHAPEFQPRRQLILASGTATPRPAAGEIEEPVVVEDSVTKIRLKATRKEPGWLLALQPYLPGWFATVNGAWQPLLRANGCFTAVAVPAGESEIVLDYAPRSFRGGIVLAIIGAVLSAVLFLRDKPR